MLDLYTVPGFNKYVNKADNRYNTFIDMKIIFALIDFTKTRIKIISKMTRIIRTIVQEMKL